MQSDQTPNSRGGLAGFAIGHPHLVVVACIVLVILGALSLVSLPKDLLPAANLPAVQILSFYAGMPVEHVEKNLSARFERYTGQAIGIERQESKSLVGVSVVKNFFGSDTDLNSAIAQTTSLVMSVLRRLPPGTQPPLILPFDPMAAVPLALVAVSGDKTEKELYDAARYDVRNSIQSVQGAMAPTVMGGAERQVVVFLDPNKLRQFNLSSLDVIEKLNRLNTFIPSGDIKVGQFDYQILSNGIVDHIRDMDQFPLRSENGVPVLLKQIGETRDASKIQTNVVMVDGKRQVYVPVYRQPGANSLRVVDEIREGLGHLESRLDGIHLRLVADQSVFIRKAIESITEETLIGGGLAAIMVLLFLGNPRATGGIMLSLPLSLLCAFLGLKATGQSLNAMTLGGLALSIGVLVDNSIVVLENITQRLGSGADKTSAVVRGASEVAMPVLASTLATLVVFFPVVFLTGVVKVLFSALAKSVMFAMIGSYLVALTVIPLFASRYLKPQKPGDLRGLLGFFQARMQSLIAAYGRALGWALAHGKKILFVLTAALLLAAVSASTIGTELFPRADAGNFVLELRQASGTRIEETEKFARQVEADLRQWIPQHDLAMVITNAGVYYGFPAAFTPNSGPQDVFFNVELTEDRDHSSQYYAKIVRERIAQKFPGVEVGVELGGLLTSALNGGLRAPIDIQIEGPKLEESHRMAEELAQRIRGLRGAVDVRVQQRFDAPQINLDVSRQRAGELGVTTDEVVKNVVSAVSGSSTFNPAIWVDPNSGIDYLLGVQFPESSVTSLESLRDIPVKGARQDRTVPLHDIATITQTKGASEINHVNLRPVVDIFLDAQGRDIGGLSRDVARVIREYGMPTGYTADIRGEISEMNKSVSSLGGGFLLAAVLVYLILVVQFESFLLPAIVMVTVPMGLVGIILMLAATRTYFSIQAAIGAIFMIGIAVANGVLLIEFILHETKEEKDVRTAIVKGAQARLRPILMTSLASMLGLVPMAIGLGRGAEANIPLGRAVIGGQLLSTCLTLFVVPILFRLLYRHRAIPAMPTFGLLLALGLGLGAHAAQAAPVELDLPEVLTHAANADHGVSAAGFREKAREESVRAARAPYFPTLDLEAIDSTGFPGSTSALQIGGLMGSPYRSGLAGGLLLKQTLWDFGRTSSSVEAAKHDLLAERQSTRLVTFDTYREAAHAFFECLRYRAQGETWGEILQEANLVDKEVKQFIRTGQRSVVERYLADSQVEEALTAQADFTEKTRLSEARLALLTGLPAVICPRLSRERDRFSFADANAAQNPRTARAEEQSLAARARVGEAKAAFWPKLVGLASVGTMENVRLVGRKEYALGIGVTLPLFDGLRTTSELHRAEAEAASRADLVEATREEVSDVNLQFDQTAFAAKGRLEHLNRELSLAEDGFRLAKRRYQALQGTLVDVREALKNLMRTQTQRNDTEVDYWEALALKSLFNGARP